jgi:hypothetical protein
MISDFMAFFPSEEASTACIQPKTDLGVTIVTNPELSGGLNLHRTLIIAKMPLFAVCQHWLKLHVLHYITMAHHDRCIREHIIALAKRVARKHFRTLRSFHVYSKVMAKEIL